MPQTIPQKMATKKSSVTKKSSRQKSSAKKKPVKKKGAAKKPVTTKKKPVAKKKKKKPYKGVRPKKYRRTPADEDPRDQLYTIRVSLKTKKLLLQSFAKDWAYKSLAKEAERIIERAKRSPTGKGK